jgi:hypothetical protein
MAERREPALSRFDRFGIRDPSGIGLRRLEFPVERIGGKASMRVALRGGLARALHPSADPQRLASAAGLAYVRSALPAL